VVKNETRILYVLNFIRNSYVFLCKHIVPVLELIKHHVMKAYGGSKCIIPPFLTLALDGIEWSASRPGRSTPREIATGIHWIGGWVGPRSGVDVVDKRLILTLPRLEPWPSSA
jgi:hypothetical protein